MVLPQKLEYLYIIVNIFANTQSILKILPLKRDGFDEYVFVKKNTTMFTF